MILFISNTQPTHRDQVRAVLQPAADVIDKALWDMRHMGEGRTREHEIVRRIYRKLGDLQTELAELYDDALGVFDTAPAKSLDGRRELLREKWPEAEIILFVRGGREFVGAVQVRQPGRFWVTYLDDSRPPRVELEQAWVPDHDVRIAPTPLPANAGYVIYPAHVSDAA